MSEAPLFTVFTPTYNRAHTLPRVFESLCRQTLRDFEWLVIDDGSTDDTAGVVADFAAKADFPVRYLRQENSGKHIAHNRALREARGELFLPFDSDDACTPSALERMAHHWSQLPDAQRDAFCGIGGLCRDQHGRLVGDRFPTDPFDADLREMIYVHRVRGEKWAAVRTDIARRYPFAEIRGTRFTPEGSVWLEMAKRYKFRWVNDVLRIYYVDDPVTGATLSKRDNLAETAPGRLHYYVWLLNNDLGYFFHSPVPFLKAALMLPVVARLSGRPLGATLRALDNPWAKALVLLGLPASLLKASLQKLAERRRRAVENGW